LKQAQENTVSFVGAVAPLVSEKMTKELEKALVLLVPENYMPRVVLEAVNTANDFRSNPDLKILASFPVLPAGQEFIENAKKASVTGKTVELIDGHLNVVTSLASKFDREGALEQAEFKATGGR
jgi:hypothetical protein